MICETLIDLDVAGKNGRGQKPYIRNADVGNDKFNGDGIKQFAMTYVISKGILYQE